MLPIKRILVPVDWSEPSIQAFELAVSFAANYGSEVTVLYVVPVPVIAYGPAPEDYLRHVQEELCHLKADAPKICTRHLVVEGEPATAIIKAAAENDCDLIVIGTHGRTGLNRILQHSVAEEVVRRAPCMVLTVKPEVCARLTAKMQKLSG